MSVLAVIPARWKSTRFPGKPLVKLAGREMIARVWDRVCETPSVNDVVVATDDEKIADFCSANNMDVLMTRSDHVTGSDRLAEVATKILISLSSNPTFIFPLIMAIVAGIDPFLLTASIDNLATLIFSG